METLKSKAILLFENAHSFTTKLVDGGDDERNSTEWDVTYVPNIKKIYKEVVTIVKQLEDASNFYKDKRIKDLITIGIELRKRLFRLQTIHSDIKEESATNQGGATSIPGKGMQYTSKFAFKKNKPVLGYKPVPKLNKESQIKVKKLFKEEQTPNLDNFQKERIDVFDDIRTKLNNMLPMVSNAKNDTIEYYNNNPTSFELHISTEIILNYLKKIEQLLNPNQ
jgi:hypothetical protein